MQSGCHQSCRYAMQSHAPVPCRVVHLDLKSSNVLIAGDGSAKISDVGLAALMSQNYLSQMAPAGTWSWVAPEVILGGKNLSAGTCPCLCLMSEPVQCMTLTSNPKVNLGSLLLTFCGRAPDILIWQESQLPGYQGLTSSVSQGPWRGKGACDKVLPLR